MPSARVHLPNMPKPNKAQLALKAAGKSPFAKNLTIFTTNKRKLSGFPKPF